MDNLSLEKVRQYIALSEEALTKALAAPEDARLRGAREDFLDMIARYIADAKHFRDKGDLVNAFAAINYAHGWLDAGARIGLWVVRDSRLFTVDDA